VQTNAYTEKAPTVLQAAAFLEIEIFLQNAGKIAMRENDLKMAATALEGEKAMQQTDRTQSAST
jgi:hypothetical protein